MEPTSSAGPLVGRAQELEQVEASLDALGEERGGCLAIDGEPGIGKTRLLGELIAGAERRGHLVLAGSAAEFERDIPFSVWVDALDAYVASQNLDLDDETGRRAGHDPAGASAGPARPKAMRSPTSATAPTAPLSTLLGRTVR